MTYEPETRTDIEELYNERIAAFNIALNERITGSKNDLEFERRQNKILRDKIEFLDLEIISNKRLYENLKNKRKQFVDLNKDLYNNE